MCEKVSSSAEFVTPCIEFCVTLVCVITKDYFL